MEKDNSKFYTLLGKFANRSNSTEEATALGILLNQASESSFSANSYGKLNAEFNQLESYKAFEVSEAWDDVEHKFQAKTGALNFNRVRLIAAMILILVIALFAYTPFAENSVHSYATITNSQYLLLDDLTEVKLASQSNLQQHALRVVELEGDAFFHVTNDQNSNFEILTKFATLKVLGTSFKIDQSDTSMTIQMREGTLEIQTLNVSDQVYKIKGEDLAVINAEGVEILKGSSENLLEDFIFNNDNIESVIKDINGSFNGLIDTNFDRVDDACLLTANFNNLSLLEIMEELSLLFELVYEVQNGRVQISALTCH